MTGLRIATEMTEKQLAAQRVRSVALEIESHLKLAIRDLAANLLRVIAGGGKEQEIVSQLAAVSSAYSALNALTGTAAYPNTPSSAMAETLRDLAWRVSSGHYAPPSADDLARWESDGSAAVMEAEGEIVQHALRVAAGQLSRQPTQERLAKNGLHGAISEYNEARQERSQSLRR